MVERKNFSQGKRMRITKLSKGFFRLEVGRYEPRNHRMCPGFDFFLQSNLIFSSLRQLPGAASELSDEEQRLTVSLL